MAERDFQQVIIEELLAYLEPLTAVADEPAQLLSLFYRLGWDIETALSPQSSAFLNAVSGVTRAVDQASRWAEQGPKSIDEVLTALQDLRRTLEAIEKLPQAIQGINLTGFERLPVDLIERLFLDYLADRSPLLYRVLQLISIVQMGQTVAVERSGTIVRFAQPQPRLVLGQVPKLLGDPIGTLRAAYGVGNSLSSAEELAALSDALWPVLAELLQALGADTLVGRGAVGMSLTDPAAVGLEDLLTFRWQWASEADDVSEAGATLLFVPAANGGEGPGVAVYPFWRAELTQDLGQLVLVASLDAEVDEILIRRTGVKMALLADDFSEKPGAPVKANLSVELGRAPSDDGPWRIGSTNETRLELGDLRVSGRAALATDSQDFQISVELSDAAFVFAAGNADGFLRIVLGNGFRVAFDLGLHWSKNRGLWLTGGGGLEVEIPVHETLLIFRVETVFLAITARDAGLGLAVATNAGIKLGPFQAAVERMGLRIDWTFPSDRLLRLERLGFMPPKGIGLSLDAGTIVGAGYLRFDPDKGEYAGMIHVEIKSLFAITAIGILNTRMPDGSPGFSLLIILCGKFPPIQLGYGFSLTGVGGLLGVNRTMDTEAMLFGLKSGILASIMFPENVIENIFKIISDIKSAFPVAPGQHVLGPMLRISWGTSTMVSLEVGVVLEVGRQLRVAIIGKLRIATPIPDERIAVVLLRIDILGTFDPQTGDIWVSASLYDSRIQLYTVEGDAAIHLNVGSNPAFELAVGGFHPEFRTPTTFPPLRRMAISIGRGDFLRLRLEAYMALTPNTFQMGAAFELYAGTKLVIGETSIQAYMGFDLLIRRRPGSTRIDLEFVINISVSVYIGGKLVASADVHGVLTGPQPWHARGVATFEFGMRYSFPFNLSSGDTQVEMELEPVDPMVALATALADPCNWGALIAAGMHASVTLREVDPIDNAIYMHPYGQLSFSQQVLPLKERISKVGDARLTRDHCDLDVKTVRVGALTVEAQRREPLMEKFAPAQFREMIDDDKLSQPSFVPMKSGEKLHVAGMTHGPGRVAPVNYEQSSLLSEASAARLASNGGIVIPRPRPLPVRLIPTMEEVRRMAQFGAAGDSVRLRTGEVKFRGPILETTILPEAYVVANCRDLRTVDLGLDSELPMTYTQAIDAMQHFELIHPDQVGLVQVMSIHDVEII